MIERYRRGESCKSLARFYKCDHTSILYHVRKRGVHEARINTVKNPKSPKKRRKPFEHPIIRKQMIQDYQSGMRLGEIGYKYGVTDVTVLKYLKFFGVPKRPRINRTRTILLPRKLPQPEDPRDHINPGKNYAEILADAVRRGDKTIKAVIGSRLSVRSGRISYLPPGSEKL